MRKEVILIRGQLYGKGDMSRVYQMLMWNEMKCGVECRDEKLQWSLVCDAMEFVLKRSLVNGAILMN